MAFYSYFLHYHYINPPSPSFQDTKNKLRKWIIPLCNIHTAGEETLGKGPKGEGKEELGEEEWVSLNTLSLMRTKIWQDYSTSLELNRREERVFFFWNGGKGGLYNSSGENINEMSFNEGWQRIMNLDLILSIREIWCIKCKDWWEWRESKIRFSCSYCNSL